jgi:hypothetical protein
METKLKFLIMNKITFFFLISSVLGFSQSLPINFNESTDPSYYFTCFDCGFNLTTDPDDSNNNVGSITSYNYAEFGSAQTIELDQYVDLSDDSNNTITLRIKPLNGTGSGNHMLKFSGGSTPFGAEVRFTTTGTDWQTISLDFGPGLGIYRNLIIFPDFQSFQTDIYLIDDIAGAVNTPPRARPSQSAPIPTIAANKVKSVYGETYINIAYAYNFAESFREVDIENNGNKALEVDLGYYGAAFANTDVSSELYVHFDYWTTDATKFALRVNSETPLANDKEYVLGSGGSEPIIKDAWTSVFIPLSHYDNLGVNLQDVYQYNFVDSGGRGTVFIDNIYFTNETNLSVNDIDLASIKVSPNPTSSSWNIKTSNHVISSVRVFNVLGKNIMSLSPNSNNFSIDSNNLKAGLYFAQISTLEGKTSSIKLVRN